MHAWCQSIGKPGEAKTENVMLGSLTPFCDYFWLTVGLIHLLLLLHPSFPQYMLFTLTGGLER